MKNMSCKGKIARRKHCLRHISFFIALSVLLTSMHSSHIIVPEPYLNRTSMQLWQGQKKKVVWKNTKLSPNSFKWSTSDSSVATIDDNGMIFANSPGKAIITSTGGGVTNQCEINVY